MPPFDNIIESDYYVLVLYLENWNLGMVENKIEISYDTKKHHLVVPDLRPTKHFDGDSKIGRLGKIEQNRWGCVVELNLRRVQVGKLC